MAILVAEPFFMLGTGPVGGAGRREACGRRGSALLHLLIIALRQALFVATERLARG
jgi:hypothetical protein